MLPQPQTLTLAPAGNHSPVLFGGKGKVFILDVIENLELEFIFKNLFIPEKWKVSLFENNPEF